MAIMPGPGNAFQCAGCAANHELQAAAEVLTRLFV